MDRSFSIRYHTARLVNLNNLDNQRITRVLTQVSNLPKPIRVIQTLPGGYNSDILRVETVDGQPNLITKCYGLKKRPFTKEEAWVTACDLLHYRSLMQGLGVSIPRLFDLAIVGHPDFDRHWLVCTEEYVGEDQVETLRSGSDIEVMVSVQRILDVTAPFFDHNYQPLKIGIDPLPGNYCQSADRLGLTYVDFMPPRFFKNGRYLVEWPPPTSEIGQQIGFWKHFTPVGLLTIMLTQLCRYRPTGRPLFKQTIIDSLAKRGQEQLIDDLVNLPGWSYTNQSIDRPTIQRLIIKNIYLVRNLACEIAYLKGLTSNRLDAFFKLCHFEDQFAAALVDRIVESFFDLYQLTGRGDK